MFAEVNNLPADDPLRLDAGPGRDVALEAAAPSKPAVPMTLSAKALAQFRLAGGTTSTMSGGIGNEQAAISAPKSAPLAQTRADGGVVVDAGARVAVPIFDGETLRSAVEQAGNVGLRVQPVGSGIARQQAPAAGTMVPSGTEIVVRFSR